MIFCEQEEFCMGIICNKAINLINTGFFQFLNLPFDSF